MYDYKTEKPKIFTEENQRGFLEATDKARKLLADAGAVKMGKLIGAGDSWVSMAFVDRLVELGELAEIEYGHKDGSVAGQDRIFVKG